ncbi:YjfB family protein [Sporomusa termitida]|uniref:Motility protein n=1 Tax=Sporomusa termitida TaxID=2377 RepID=A0A517DZP8_9FIRM|nr:YjfB family protein [Sporomusa termitida]QDR82835.1 Putative motility protein [Sporomusa termitida]
MDIAALSSAASQMNVSNQASILVMKKVMDAASAQNQGLLELLPATAARISPSHLGNSINISV